MPLRPQDIYLVARHAGFSPDQAVTMTAIALAESGGNPLAYNAVGENSVGLWQVNLAAHPQFAGADGTDPLTNARLAFEVSGGGRDIGRWTVTHADKGAPYLNYRDEAEAAARAAGESGVGSWDPPDNYYSPKVSAGPSGGMSPPPLPFTDGAPMGGDGGDSGALDTFLDAALSQEGDPYIFGAEADLDDVDPDSFDCSELVQWAAARAGVEVSDGSYNQYLELRDEGADLTVEEALRTPGALVFSFSSEPVPGGGRPSQAHVAISLGDGRLIEARGRSYGVGIFEAEGRTFTHAAYVPELGTELVDDVVTGQLTVGVDSDADGLLDAYERIVGTDPFAPDTDRDGYLDSAELIEHHTDPLDFGDNPLVEGGMPMGAYRPPLTSDLRGEQQPFDPLDPADGGDPLRPGRTATSPLPLGDDDGAPDVVARTVPAPAPEPDLDDTADLDALVADPAPDPDVSDPDVPDLPDLTDDDEPFDLGDDRGIDLGDTDDDPFGLHEPDNDFDDFGDLDAFDP